ncbi:MAG TPA: hypothetical protein VHY59_00510 [Chthoniobacterales bacterium]|jgi:hypothetical protein|nr:hypothetical protein [Chthoniobacterales bacterium]
MLRNIQELEKFIHSAKRGERAIYHTGYLPRDGKFIINLPALAKGVWDHSLTGTIVPLQKRLGEHNYEYIIVRC